MADCVFISENEDITKSKLDQAKTSVDTALTTTGQGYTWTKWPITQGNLITAADITELRNATDVAYGAFALYSAKLNVDNSNNGYDSADYGDDGDNGYCRDNNYCNHDSGN